MFLVRGPIPHEDTWTRWIGNLSHRVVPRVWCSRKLFDCYQSAMRSKPIESVYDQQSFFSIVVHARPGFEGYAAGSIFNGKLLDERVEVLRPMTRGMQAGHVSVCHNNKALLLCRQAGALSAS